MRQLPKAMIKAIMILDITTACEPHLVQHGGELHSRPSARGVPNESHHCVVGHGDEAGVRQGMEGAFVVARARAVPRPAVLREAWDCSKCAALLVSHRQAAAACDGRGWGRGSRENYWTPIGSPRGRVAPTPSPTCNRAVILQ